MSNIPITIQTTNKFIELLDMPSNKLLNHFQQKLDNVEIKPNLLNFILNIFNIKKIENIYEGMDSKNLLKIKNLFGYSSNINIFRLLIKDVLAYNHASNKKEIKNNVDNIAKIIKLLIDHDINIFHEIPIDKKTTNAQLPENTFVLLLMTRNLEIIESLKRYFERHNLNFKKTIEIIKCHDYDKQQGVFYDISLPDYLKRRGLVLKNDFIVDKKNIEIGERDCL